MALLRRVAASSSSCGPNLRRKLGFLGAVSNHQYHLLFPTQLSRQFRRPREELFYTPNTGRHFEPYELYFGSDADKLRILGGRSTGKTVNHSDLKDPEVLEPALFAVKKYNELKNANLQFVRVVKASSEAVCGIIYYITLEAIDCSEKKTYKTRVCLDASKGCILELLKFELEPSNQGNKQDFLSKAVDKRVGAEKKGGGGETKEISQVLDKLVTFLEGYFVSEKNSFDAKEVFDVVSQISDLSESEVYKACSWLVENEKHFHMLKLFADDKKKGYLLNAMPRKL